MLTTKQLRALRGGGKNVRPTPFEIDKPLWADSMSAFFADLAEEYPELRWKLDDLQNAVRAAKWQRPGAPAYAPSPDEALSTLLEFMSGTMNASYPKLTKSEQKRASEEIADAISGGKYESDDQAIAVGLRCAAPAKYKAFEKRQRA